MENQKENKKDKTNVDPKSGKERDLNEIIKEIKAVTFHDLSILKSANGYSTRIYFDI